MPQRSTGAVCTGAVKPACFSKLFTGATFFHVRVALEPGRVMTTPSQIPSVADVDSATSSQRIATTRLEAEAEGATCSVKLELRAAVAGWNLVKLKIWGPAGLCVGLAR